MDEEELKYDFQQFKELMAVGKIDEAAKIVGGYIFILTANPKKHDMPIYSNVRILLKTAPREFHGSWDFFRLAIMRLIEAADHDQLPDFRWRLN